MVTTKEPPRFAVLLTLANEHSFAVDAWDLDGRTAPAGMRLVVVAALPTSMTLHQSSGVSYPLSQAPLRAHDCLAKNVEGLAIAAWNGQSRTLFRPYSS